MPSMSKIVQELKKIASELEAREKSSAKEPIKSPKPPPADATKAEQKEFWRKKIEVAKQHKEVAIESGNGGWAKMLDKRIDSYREKIKNL